VSRQRRRTLCPPSQRLVASSHRRRGCRGFPCRAVETDRSRALELCWQRLTEIVYGSDTADWRQTKDERNPSFHSTSRRSSSVTRFACRDTSMPAWLTGQETSRANPKAPRPSRAYSRLSIATRTTSTAGKTNKSNSLYKPVLNNFDRCVLRRRNSCYP